MPQHGIIGEEDLPLSATAVLGHSHSQRINTMVCDIVEHSWPVRGNDIAKPTIAMSPPILGATNELREFLFERVYNLHAAQEEAEKAREVVRLLYNYFNEHADKLPPEYSFYSDEPEQRVVDYIAGMTDQYALRLAEELSLTKSKVK